VVLAAAFVKGAVGFGFPMLATPLLALVIDVKSAVAALIVPNMVMDGIQSARRGGLLGAARRLGPVLVFGALGTVAGTRLLILLSPGTALGLLGGFVLAFVALNATPFTPRVPPRWERWLGPPVGFLAGVMGGLTNVPGTLLVIYFYALGMAKHEFVRATSLSFLTYKLVQLAAVAYYGLLTWPLLAISFGLTAVGLGGFVLGLRVQERLEPRAFNRAVLVFLGVLGVWLVIRAAR
jgi:uncharacterized membrane protein YfcA